MKDNGANYNDISLEDFLDLPDELAEFSKVKSAISQTISEQCKVQNISVRKLGEKVGLKHPQIIRITSGDANYNIDTLIKVLVGLNLQIQIVPKDSVRE